MSDSDRYFLKCNHCGYLTEILNDSHTWCFNCTKRFINFYKGWQPEQGKKNLNTYKELFCVPYSEMDIESIVKENNKKVEIKETTKEQKIRRAYIKAGIPLDRGGQNEWDFRQYKMYLIGLLIIGGIIGIFLLIAFLVS